MTERAQSNNTQPTMDDLLLDPFQAPTAPAPAPAPVQDAVKPGLLDTLTPDEQEKARQLAKQIPAGDYEAILTYGSNAQTALTQFSHQMLNHVQAKNAGPVGDVITDLMNKLREIDPDELQDTKKSGLARLFGKAMRPLQEVMAKYQKLSTQIDRISVQLESSKRGLVEDVHMLDKLYDQNKQYFQALNVYIAAAELKREEIQQSVLPALREKAERSSDQMAYQEVTDMVNYVDRLEKRAYDLQLSRQITIQSAPQIRMIQQTNQTLAEKIQSSLTTSIPLWKNQIAIALTLNNQKKAVEAQKKVSATTNELLLRNSEMLKMNSIETAKENERGIVEIETLKKTQENLLETLEETLRIQQDGRAKRKEAELELARMEQDLKQRLLSVHQQVEQNRSV